MDFSNVCLSLDYGPLLALECKPIPKHRCLLVVFSPPKHTCFLPSHLGPCGILIKKLRKFLLQGRKGNVACNATFATNKKQNQTTTTTKKKTPQIFTLFIFLSISLIWLKDLCHTHFGNNYTYALIIPYY